MTLIVKPAPLTISPSQAWGQLKARISSVYSNLSMGHTNAFNFLWSQPDPMAVLVAAGTDAKALWDTSSAIQTLLKSVDADYVELVPVAIPEFNADGSIKTN